MNVNDPQFISKLEERIKSYGYLNDLNNVSQYGSELFLKYLIYKTRIISDKKRKVHYSKVLGNKVKNFPNRTSFKIKRLQSLFEKGYSVHEYESRQLLGKNKKGNSKKLSTLWDDAQFSMLHIKHLHLKSKGSDKLLFVWVGDKDVYFLDVLPHIDKNTKDSNFYTLKFLFILKNEFPGLMKKYEMPYVKGEVDSNGKPVDTKNFSQVVNGVTCIFQYEGIVYYPFNHGVTTKTYCNQTNTKGVVGVNVIELQNSLSEQLKQISSIDECFSVIDDICMKCSE